MKHYYQDLDSEYFDYQPIRLFEPGGPVVRGPLPDLHKPFVACLGAAPTFGRFCNAPYPALLARYIGIPAANIGIGGSGPRTFLNPSILQLLNRAVLVVVQVMSGRSESNSYFSKAEHMPDHWGVRVADGKYMRFEQFLDEFISSESYETTAAMIQETRERYLHNHETLFKQIKPPTILHWFSKRSPDWKEEYGSVWSLLGPFPHLVNRSMIERMGATSDAYVETICSDGLPQRLWQAQKEIDGATLRDGYLYNEYYPSPEMHARAAEQLLPKVMELIDANHFNCTPSR